MTSPNRRITRKRVKIPVSELQLGMYIAELDRPWAGTPFLYQGFYLYTPEDIRDVRDVCEWVYIDAKQEDWTESVEKTISMPSGKKTIRIEQPRSRTTYLTKIPVSEEMPHAQQAFRNTRQQVFQILDGLRFGDAIDVAATEAVVAECVESIIRNPNALLCLSQIKNRDEYTAEHSLRVCLLSLALGRELGLLEGELQNLGISALLHDVGKVRIPLEILNKPGALTPDEFETMTSHTTQGKQILIANPGVYKGAVDVALSHHERMDGHGYPRQLQAHQIAYFAKIVSVADAYDAINSERIYKPGKSGLETLRILYDCRHSHFDGELVDAFIKTIGVYPVGHIAEMTNDEVGIIVASDSDYRLRPQVLLVLDKHHKPCRERGIDLKLNAVDKLGKPYRVKAIHKNGAFGIQLETYLAKGLKIRR
ncbi:MAG: HD-GYP domain-containing protein [Hahellaceae bacterium]|nr:HD-GYP domain-containing protein [Hahellaceae bacterium]MCP5170587.1 HD-GYP domain-containing protein [Hahellaceae bacterium]